MAQKLSGQAGLRSKDSSIDELSISRMLLRCDQNPWMHFYFPGLAQIERMRLGDVVDVGRKRCHGSLSWAFPMALLAETERPYGKQKAACIANMKPYTRAVGSR